MGMLLGFIRKNPNNKFVLAVDWSKVDAHMAKDNASLAASTRINLDPEALRWAPQMSGGSIYGSPFKPNFSSPEKKRKKKKKKLESESKDSTTSSSDSDNKDSDAEDVKSPTTKSHNKKEKSTTTNSNQKKNKKSEQKPSGECKGMAGGSNLNINNTLKKIQKSSANSVATALNFEDLANDKVTTNNISKTIASEKQPKRSFNKNNGPSSPKKGYKSSILGQAIGKLLEKKKYSDTSSDADADVEDELSETDLTFEQLKKPKKVQKSPDKNSSELLPRYRRAAASKASDRINRESRGRISLSSSSDEDSRISDLGDDHDDQIDSDDSDFKPITPNGQPPIVKIQLKRKLSTDSIE